MQFFTKFFPVCCLAIKLLVCALLCSRRDVGELTKTQSESEWYEWKAGVRGKQGQGHEMESGTRSVQKHGVGCTLNHGWAMHIILSFPAAKVKRERWPVT